MYDTSNGFNLYFFSLVLVFISFFNFYFQFYFKTSRVQFKLMITVIVSLPLDECPMQCPDYII